MIKMGKSARILAILYLLLCPDPAASLLTSRRPISHPGNRAQLATISPSDPAMRFQFVGKAKVTQGTGHLVATMPLLQGSMAALEGIGAAKLTLEEVKEKHPPDSDPGYEDSRELSFRQLQDKAEAMYHQVLNLNAAAGTAQILDQAVHAGVTAQAVNFQDGLDSREAFLKQLLLHMPPSYIDTLREHGYNVTQYDHLREASSNPGTGTNHRQERSLLLLAGAALLGGGFGIYNTIQIRQIKAQVKKAASERSLIAHAVTELNTKTNSLIHGVNQLTAQIATNRKARRLFNLADTLLQKVELLVSHMLSVMNSALSQRMDASMVQQVAWQEELDQLAEVAEREGLALVVDTPSDVVTLKAGYEVDWEGILHVLIPIPLYSPSLVMEIHRMRQMPLRTKIGWMEVHTPFPYLLATRQPHSVFTAITQETFDQCFPANDFLVCPALDKLYKPNRVTEGQHAARCLYALKRKWEEDVEKHCALTVIKEEEDARRIAHNQFAVFSNKPATVEIACKDDSTSSKRIPDGLHLITLPMSCVAETSALFLQPSVDVEAGTETRDDVIRFPPAVTRVSNATTNTLKKIKSELDAIKTNLPPTPTLDWLTEHIDTIGQIELDDGTWAIIGLVLFIITAGIVTFVVVKCKKRRARQLQQQRPMGAATTNITLGYPAMPPPMAPDRPPNYAYPGNGPSFDPAAAQQQPQQTLSRTQSYLNLLKQAEQLKL